ncbi:MAG: hypothetical protein QY323_01345 [Patescibacteria group bacterium]|nr:MAG: hypothetical protein QY323_01345 [Patescibacteria group bacterium]
MDFAKTMHRRYYHALSFFYLFDALREARAPNVLGQEEAEANVKTMSGYRHFFILAEKAFRTNCLLELAKMFDTSKQALSINKVLGFTEGNMKNLTVEAFEEYNQNRSREFLDELVVKYKAMNYGELVDIKKMLDRHADTLARLETYRDKWLAHDDVEKPQPPELTVDEIRDLLDVLARVLNAITGRLNSETWTYSHVEAEAKGDVRTVIDHLRRFEPYKRQETEQMLRK